MLHPVGPQKEVNITGYVTPFDGDQPHLLTVRGIDGTEEPDLFLPVFSTIDKLRAFGREFGIYDPECVRIKKIDDGKEFLMSVIAHTRVVIDPYKHANGKLRFTELTGMAPDEGGVVN